MNACVRCQCFPCQCTRAAVQPRVLPYRFVAHERAIVERRAVTKIGAPSVPDRPTRKRSR